MKRFRTGQEQHLDRRTQVERELSLIVARIDRAMDALLNGGPRDELIARLNEEKARQAALTEELSRLGQFASVLSLDAERVKRKVHERVAVVKALLDRQTSNGRQMLRKLLKDKLELDPSGKDASAAIGSEAR